MKMMNFRRFDPDYIAEGKVGLTRGNKLEEVIWNEFSNNPPALADAVSEILAAIKDEESGTSVEKKSADATRAPSSEQPYWVFVCNPKKWAIDRFLDRRVEYDTWGIRPSDRARFSPGQLGIIRVGVDRRSVSERNGDPPLEAGIYALCEVDSEAFPGTGANDEFWAESEARTPGWPTVKLRYLRSYLDNPLTIERLKAEAPGISQLLLNGFQASSFPISTSDFHTVLGFLGEELDDLPSPIAPVDTTSDKLAALEQKYLHASPEIKSRVSKTIERGQVGAIAKKATGYKCQICEAFGLPPLGFKKSNGQHYVEAHHVMPVAKMEVGSLAASNVMTLCANHHRQMHYGDVTVTISATTFDITIEGTSVQLPRLGIPAEFPILDK